MSDRSWLTAGVTAWWVRARHWDPYTQRYTTSIVRVRAVRRWRDDYEDWVVQFTERGISRILAIGAGRLLRSRELAERAVALEVLADA